MQKRFQTFTALIKRIKRDILKISAEEMAEFNLRAAHVNCIYYVYANGPITATELCELCMEDKAAISRNISYLEKRGFLVSAEGNDTHKKYKVPLALTDEGKAIADRLCQKIEKTLKEVSEGLDEENRRIMYESLTLISNNLENISKRY